jgi:hypothetical protein
MIDMKKRMRKQFLKNNETYITACRVSPIQDIWKPKYGDMTDQGIIERKVNTWFVDGEGYIEDSPYKTNNLKDLKKNLVWLPIQEQWQNLYEQLIHKIPPNVLYTFFQSNPGALVDSNVSHCFTWMWCKFFHEQVYRLEWNFKGYWEKINPCPTCRSSNNPENICSACHYDKK